MLRCRLKSIAYPQQKFEDVRATISLLQRKEANRVLQITPVHFSQSDQNYLITENSISFF